jgi:hypothetical protein
VHYLVNEVNETFWQFTELETWSTLNFFSSQIEELEGSKRAKVLQLLKHAVLCFPTPSLNTCRVLIDRQTCHISVQQHIAVVLSRSCILTRSGNSPCANSHVYFMCMWPSLYPHFFQDNLSFQSTSYWNTKWLFCHFQDTGHHVHP